jgi:fructose-bisphosphate aldolase class 1
MTTTDVELIAHSIAANDKGILAADETPGTLTPWRRQRSRP